MPLKVTPKAYFCLSLLQVNLQLFHPPELCLIAWRNSSQKKWLAGCHVELYLAARRCLCNIILPQLKICRKEKFIQLTFHPSQGQLNVFFPNQLSNSLSSLFLFSEFGARLAKNNAVSEQSQPRVAVKRPLRGHSTRIVLDRMMLWKSGPTPK